MTPQEKFAAMNEAKAKLGAPDWLMSQLENHPSLIEVVPDAPEDSPIWDDFHLRMVKALAVVSLSHRDKVKDYVPMIEGAKVVTAITDLCGLVYNEILDEGLGTVSIIEGLPSGCEEAFRILTLFSDTGEIVKIPEEHVAQMITILKAQNEGE